MRTECPECQTAFRVTAALLRQAHGKVRCGDCGHVFDALDYLFEDSQAAADDRAEPPAGSLLGALQNPGDADDVRIEDTGVEWRVLNVIEPASDTDSDAANSDEASNPAPGTDWSVEHPLDLTAADDAADDDAAFAEASDLLTVGRGEGDSDNDAELPSGDGDAAPQEGTADSTDAADEAPGTAAADAAAQAPRYDDDTPLPDEFVDTTGSAEDDAGIAAAEAAGAHDEADAEALRVTIDTGTEEDWQALLDEVGDDAAADSASNVTGDAADDAAEVEATPDDDTGTAEPETAGEPEPVEVDRATDAAAGADAATTAANSAATHNDDDDDESLVESIVMEGETVTDLLERAERASFDNVPPPELDDEPGLLPPIRRAGIGRVAVYAAIPLLVLALAAQLVHANRESLATQPLFQQTVAPVYEALGQPVQPAWDARGWQFEATSGSTDAANENLTIRSKVSNRSSGALPYPLLHVSLTDRFDEVIGSRMLTPPEYLAGNSRRPVRAGGSFDAVIVVSAPAAAATGFKLNVCYPQADGQARCAVEDFRD